MLARTLCISLPLVLLVAVESPARGQSHLNALESEAADASATSRPSKFTLPYISPQIFLPLEQHEALPNIHVLDIVQDEQGFLWIATQGGGLVRYDGHQLRIYAKEESAHTHLPTSYITALEIDAAGRLWVGTGDAGIIIYNPKTDTFSHRPNYQSEEGGPQTTTGIKLLYRDRAGTMWIGAENGVLSQFDEETDTFQHTRIFQELESDVTAIAQSRDDALWIGTGTAGLFKFDPVQKRVLDHYFTGSGAKDLSSNMVRAVLEDTAGNVWVGTTSGIDRLDPEREVFVRYQHRRNALDTLSDNRITAIFQAADGRIWIGTENGVNILNGDGRTFTRFIRDTSSSPATVAFPVYITGIYQDRGGVLWFSAQSGIRKVPDMRMRFNPFESGSWGHDIISFEDGDEPGVFWGGSYTNGLQKFDRNKQTITVYEHLGARQDPRSVSLTKWIMVIHRDRRGHLWLGGRGLGLIWLDPKTERYKQYLPHPDNMMEGPTHDEIHSIVEDREGYLWLGTWGGGLNRFDPESESFIDFVSDAEDPTTLSDDFLYKLLLDNQDPNVLWVGTRHGGLNRFDIAQETAIHYELTPEGGDPYGYNSIQTIHQDKDGILWLGTTGAGLVRLDPKTQHVEYFTDKDGLSNSTIYGILADEKGSLWMSTNGGGLAVFDPEAKTFTTYTTADGLVSNEFIQNGYHKLETGEMIFGLGGGTHGFGGFNLFDPRTIEPETYAPPVIITGFQLFNEDAKLEQPIWTTPDLSLAYTDSVFSFEFAALSYKAPGQLRYAYKMDGLHDWIETSRRFVTYTNLDGGDYVFRVRASNHHGTWSENMATLRIKMASPPWKTWWAYLIYGLTGLGVVFGYLRYQSRKVESLRQAHRLESVERELELTGAVQSGFLPKSNHIDNAMFHLHGFYRPADQAGGDWWWYEESAAKLTILVGDVTGHGAGPAMVTAAAATAFRIQGKNTSLTIADRLAACNEEVLRVGNGNYQMTMSAVELDGQTGRFTFYSAGGLPIMRVRYDGRPRTLLCSGTPLGSRDFSVGKVEGTMTPGERMVIYTDGIPEMPVGQNRQLGMRRFSMICESTQGLDIHEAAQRIVTVSDAIRQNATQDDDWTFALLEWTGGQGKHPSAEPTMVPQEPEAEGWSDASEINEWAEPSQFDDGTNPGRSGGPRT